MTLGAQRAALVLAVAAAVAGISLWRTRVRDRPNPAALTVSIDGWSEGPMRFGYREHLPTVFIRVASTDSAGASDWSELVARVRLFGRKGPTAPWEEPRLLTDFRRVWSFGAFAAGRAERPSDDIAANEVLLHR